MKRHDSLWKSVTLNYSWKRSHFHHFHLECHFQHSKFELFGSSGLQLHDGYIVAGPECGVNPSPGPGRWGNGTASARHRPDHMIVAELGLGNWWPLFQKAWVLQVTGFPQGISTNFKFRMFFSSMCFKCFKDHSKKSAMPVHSSSAHRFHWVFLPRGSGGFCWSLENYWKFQAESGGCCGPFSRGCPVLRLTRCHEWMDDGILGFQEGIDVMFGYD